MQLVTLYAYSEMASDSISEYFSKFSWGGMPPDPLALAKCYEC